MRDTNGCVRDTSVNMIFMNVGRALREGALGDYHKRSLYSQLQEMNSDRFLDQLKILPYFNLGWFLLHKKWVQCLLIGSELRFIACRIESIGYVDHLTLQFLCRNACGRSEV